MPSIRPVAAALALAVAVLATGCSGSARTPTSVKGSAGSSPSADTTSTLAASPPATTVVPAAWPTYHHDAGRSGVDPGQSPATPVARAWTSSPLDGAVYAEPLVVGDRVIAASENDSVYALSATTGAVLWSAKLGSPVAGSALPCGNIDPSGITGTPVIDTNTGLVWVVAFVTPGRHDLVALDLASGQVKFRRPADPPGASPLVEQERGALVLAGGTVYVPYGGLYGDCGAYHGFVLGFSATGSGAVKSWQVPTTREGGLWAPPGPVVGPGGELYVATGNTESTANFDDGNAVVRLSADLHQQDVFAPTNWAALNDSDTDLGSVSPTLLPGSLIFQIGKAGVGYLLRASGLGGVGGQLFSASVCNSAFGGTAVSGNRIFVPCRDGLVAVDVGQGRFSVAWRTRGQAAGAPVVAGGVVWMVDTGGRLQGFDKATGRVRDSVDIGAVTHFPSLAVGGGQLFAATGSRVVSFRGA
jgi:outer membrane protein assembly factor BamB